MNGAEVPQKSAIGRLTRLAIAGSLVFIVIALTGFWLLGSKPVKITRMTNPPNTSEIWIDYKQVGKLPGGPNEQFVVVAHGSDNFPFLRMVSAKDIAAGGKIGLAVPKGERFRVSIRVSEKGAAVSNTLYVTL
jgi:hypothetical protein